MIGRLARRYARALLGLTREEGTPEAAVEELERAAAAFEEPRLRAVVLSPAIAPGERVRIAKEVIGALGVSKTVSNLLQLLAERDRIGIVPTVAAAYGAMVDQVVGRTRVEVRSAAPLGQAEHDEVVELARRLTGRREVRVSVEVVPELLGGVVLGAEGTVYDGSVKTQLLRLAREMAERGA